MSTLGIGSTPVVYSVDKSCYTDHSKFLSRENLSVTSKVTPQWLSSWEGKNLSEKIKKVFIEMGRTILFSTIVIPIITFAADIVKNAVEVKKFKPEPGLIDETELEQSDPQIGIERTPPLSTTKKIVAISLVALLVTTCVVIPPLALGLYPFMKSNPQPSNGNNLAGSTQQPAESGSNAGLS